MGEFFCILAYQEIDHYFALYIQAWADKHKVSYNKLRLQIKDWYNGYHFGADVTAVYNPFSVMYAFDKQNYENFWLQSGPPFFLIKEIQKNYRIIEKEMLHYSHNRLNGLNYCSVYLMQLCRMLHRYR